MLIACVFFIISTLFILFGHEEVSLIVNSIAFIVLIISFISEKKAHLHENLNNKSNAIDSTKSILHAIKSQKFQAIDFKLLKKEDNPYFDELKALNTTLQKQHYKTQKRMKKLHTKNMQNAQLFSTISHEIKNPLSVIQASTETILMQPQIDNAMQKRLLNKIIVYSKKINALLDKLTLSQSLEHGVVAIKTESFNIKTLCEEVADGFKTSLLQETYQDKEIIVEGVSREIFADKILIEQVLSNLIYNALKYAQSQVIVRIKDRSIEVIDDGKGVEKENLNQLCKKFYQGKDATKKNHSLGLGLFIVKEIAKIHSTKVEFLTQRNKKEGLCVKFLL